MGRNPHDALFRSTFSSVEHAAAELRAVLPPELCARIDFTKLRPVSGTFIDEDLASSQSDLLFALEVDEKPSLLLLLFEHQSTVDDLMAFRVLKYVVRILDRHVRTANGARQALPLPVVIPVVLHHSETGWTAATELRELFDGSLAQHPSVTAYVPRLSFVLDDISHLTDEQLGRRALQLVPTLALWALRDSRSPERLMASLAHWASAMRALLAASGGREALVTIFRYLSLVVPDLTPEVLHQNLLTLAPEVEQVIMTTLSERWIAQGEARGRAEGEARGRAEGARRLLLSQLELKFGRLSAEQLQLLDGADAEQLRRWSLKLLQHEDILEVLSE